MASLVSLGPFTAVVHWPFAVAVGLLALAVAQRSWGLVAMAAVVAVLGAAFRFLENQLRKGTGDGRGGPL